MSVYFSLLFALLTFEMATLFILVLPLHYKIRKTLVTTYDKVFENPQLKTVITILGGLVGLLFIDSWKRSKVIVRLPHHQSTQHSDMMGNNPVTPVQALASRAYSQRNIYISGFILYFSVCIPTVVSIVRRLVKYEGLIRERDANKKSGKESDQEVEEDEEISELRKQLAQKKASVEALKKQKKNLEHHFDETVKGEQVSAETKKTD